MTTNFLRTAHFRAALALFLAAPLAAGAPAQAQDDALEQNPGYVDARTVESWFGVPPTVEINIRGALMRLVTAAARDDEDADDDLARLLSNLKAIQVRTFAADSSRLDAIEAQTNSLIDRLRRQGWETVVRVRERDENVNVQLKTEGDAIAGLVVLVSDPGEESVFINIVGDINPEEIGRIGRTFSIDMLNDQTPDDGGENQ